MLLKLEPYGDDIKSDVAVRSSRACSLPCMHTNLARKGHRKTSMLARMHSLARKKYPKENMP